MNHSINSVRLLIAAATLTLAGPGAGVLRADEPLRPPAGSDQIIYARHGDDTHGRIVIQALEENGGAYAQKFVNLTCHLQTQQNLAFCGVASSASLLNSMRIVHKPPLSERPGFSGFDQDSLMNLARRSLGDEVRDVPRSGMTLALLGKVLRASGVHAEVHYASEISVDAFRKLASSALAEEDSGVLVNFYRPALDQPGGGHISPLLLYNKEHDMFLIGDVATYKFDEYDSPTYWVTTGRLHASMNTKDGGHSRGFVIVHERGIERSTSK